MSCRTQSQLAPSRIRRPGNSFELKAGSAEVFNRAQEIDPALWAATFGQSPKDFAYYRLIEETMTDHFSYRYLVLRDGHGTAIALQPLIIADQDLTASSGPRLTASVNAIRRLAPRFLRTRMLMAGCLVGDGALGQVIGADPQEAAALLSEALVRFARREQISLITVKDFPAEYREDLQPLITAGYCRLASFPPLQLELDFRSFDEYMEQRLSKVTRKSLRRKLRQAAASSPPLQLEVTADCSEIIDEIYPLYLEVVRRSEVTFEVFTKEYFLEASRQMPDRVRFFVWRQGGKAVAFSFCTVWGKVIYDNDIGLDYSVAHELNLYYISFRDLLEWALAHGFTRYHSAPFNYDPKLRLRLEPVPVDIYVRHTSPVLNALLQRIAPWFAPAKFDPALRRHTRR